MMKNNITITVSLFGVLRQLANKNKITIEIAKGSSLPMLRDTLHEMLTQFTSEHGKLTILNHCVFATEKRILNEQELIDHSVELAVLPPFSGG